MRPVPYQGTKLHLWQVQVVLQSAAEQIELLPQAFTEAWLHQLSEDQRSASKTDFTHHV